ncbi:MAG: hypothetical protein LUE23_02710 [Lachnospiraceae bacterium]|nr:hypothetical protein [Lachnospiraceae bacterium]
MEKLISGCAVSEQPYQGSLSDDAAEIPEDAAEINANTSIKISKFVQN